MQKSNLSIFAFKKLYIWYNDTFVKMSMNIDYELMIKGIFRVEDIWDNILNDVITIEEFNRKYCQDIVRQDRLVRMISRFLEIRNKIREVRRQIQNVSSVENRDRQQKLEDFFEISERDMKSKSLYRKLRQNTSHVDYRIRKELGYVISDTYIWNFYKALYKSEIENKTRNILWLVSWKGLMVGQITKNWFPEEDGKCKVCKHEEESILHLFRDCEMINNFMRWVYMNLDLEYEGDDRAVYLNDFDRTNAYQFYILAIAKRVVWIVRNKIVFDDLKPNIIGLKKIFLEHLTSSLNILLIASKNKDKINDFSRIYCHNRIQIENENNVSVNWQV